MSTAEVIRDRSEKLPDAPGCWLWLGAVHNRQGYGFLKVGRRQTYAHRASYEAFIGKIPAGLHVCHRCDVTCCVNPSHLFLGTNRDNVDDKVRKGRQARSIDIVGKNKARGERCAWAKLNSAKVLAVRVSYASGDTLAVIAARYRVSESTISNAVRGKKWAHIPGAIMTRRRVATRTEAT